MVNKLVKNVILFIIITFVLIGCNEFNLKKYINCDNKLYASDIQVGYLVNNNKPNGLPEKSLIVHFKDKKYKAQILSVESNQYGKFEMRNYKYSIYGYDGILYIKPLNGSNKKILDKIKTDTIRINFEQNNQIKTIHFYN